MTMASLTMRFFEFLSMVSLIHGTSSSSLLVKCNFSTLFLPYNFVHLTRLCFSESLFWISGFEHQVDNVKTACFLRSKYFQTLTHKHSTREKKIFTQKNFICERKFMEQKKFHFTFWMSENFRFDTTNLNIEEPT